MAVPDRPRSTDPEGTGQAEAARWEGVFAGLRDGLRRLAAVPHLAADPEFRVRLDDLAALAAAAEDPELFYAEFDALLTYAASVPSSSPNRPDAWRRAAWPDALGAGARLSMLRV